MSAQITTNDFSAFCDFLVHLRAAGNVVLTPEESVKRFRQEQEKSRQWDERNALSDEQSRRGEYGPLDDAAMVARLKQRWADQGITD